MNEERTCPFCKRLRPVTEMQVVVLMGTREPMCRECSHDWGYEFVGPATEEGGKLVFHLARLDMRRAQPVFN